MTTRAMTLKQRDTPAATLATRQTPGYPALLRMEMLKTIRRRMTHVIFAIMAMMLAGLFSLGYLVVFVFESNPDADINDVLLPSVLGDGFEIIGMLGPILIAILAAGIAGSEFSWGTVRTMVGSGVPRARLLLAKLTVLAVASALLVITGMASLVVVSTAVSLVEGQGLSLGWLDPGAAFDLLLMLARTIFLVLVIGGIAFSISQFFRSVAAGIALGTGLLIVSPILTELAMLLGDIGETLSDYSISINMHVLMRINTFGEVMPDPDLPGPWHAAVVLALYALIPIGLAIWSFNRRDIASD